MTILFSDIEESTALNEQLGDKAWLKVLGAHDQIVRRCVARPRRARRQVAGRRIHGRLRRAPRRRSARRSGSSAVWIQGRAGLQTAGVAVRVGIHSGPALEKGGDLFGRNVALAARVADQAGGGRSW